METSFTRLKGDELTATYESTIEKPLEVRDYEDLTDLEKMALIPISYSRINSYDMCNAKYFYSYIQKAEDVFSAPAAMGNMVHSVLEDFVGHVLDLQTMLDLFHKYRERFDPEKLIPQKMIDIGTEMMGQFVDRHKTDVFHVVEKEMPFSFVLGPALINGFIDLVQWLPNGELQAVDFKSGSYEVTKKDVPTNLQLGIYAVALQKIYPGVPINVQLYYLRSGRRKSHRFSDEELEGMKARIHDKVIEIIEDRDFKHTDNKKICSFCEHAKTGTCRLGASVIGKLG